MIVDKIDHTNWNATTDSWNKWLYRKISQSKYNVITAVHLSAPKVKAECFKVTSFAFSPCWRYGFLQPGTNTHKITGLFQREVEVKRHDAIIFISKSRISAAVKLARVEQPAEAGKQNVPNGRFYHQIKWFCELFCSFSEEEKQQLWSNGMGRGVVVHLNKQDVEWKGRSPRWWE